MRAPRQTPGGTQTRRHRRRTPRLLVALALALGLGGLAGVHASTAAAVTASPYTISTGPTSGLSDGSVVPVTITSSDPSSDPVGWVDIEICRPGVDYSAYSVVRTRGNCGFSPGSSAYASDNGSAVQDFPGEPSGARSFPDNFVAGVGAASFAGFSLTCDSTHPCDLVVSVFTNVTNFNLENPAAALQAFPMTFLNAGAVPGCKGTAKDAIQTVSSDRLVDAYTDWSRDDCTSGGAKGEAPTENTFIDEGGAFGAVDSFSSGTADMAYAAGGYDLPGFSESKGRPYVAVPVALNAVVVAASGGQLVPAYTPPKTNPPVTKDAVYSHLALTATQAASLFGGGYVSPSQAKAIDAANPELGSTGQIVPYLPPGGADTFIYPQAVAGTNATTVFASTYFKDLGGKDWNSGPYAPSGKPKNVQRGVISSFALPGSEPAFTSLGLYSHRTDLERSALPPLGVGPLPLWVLTDRATAEELGFTVASLGTTSSNAVTPSQSTMDAAVTKMHKEKDGTLQPDVTASGSAYPLTFVEYALVPTQPLETAACKSRSQSETLMVNWLKYITGKGQSDLAAGLEPLTSSLRTQAEAAITKVGKAAVTGTCASKTGSTTTTTTSPTTVAPSGSGVMPPGDTTPVTDAPGGSSTATSSPASSSSTSPAKTSPGSGGGGTSSTTTVAPGTKHKLASATIPQFGAAHSGGWLLPSAALLLLGLLTGAMALRASGRSPLAALGAIAGRLRPGGKG